jgi:hypothetical protein
MNLKKFLVFLIGVISAIWLLNPPGLNLDDTIPLVGNLDEAAAALVLINCLAYFGFDLTRMFKATERAATKASSNNAVVEMEAEVIPPTK